MRDDKAWLGDILGAMRDVVAYMGNLSCEAFTADRKTIDAINRKLEIMGEAAKRLSAEVRDSHPEIPWKQMAGMRDKLIHGYNKIEPKQIFTAVTRDIPPLIPRIEVILHALPDPE